MDHNKKTRYIKIGLLLIWVPVLIIMLIVFGLYTSCRPEHEVAISLPDCDLKISKNYYVKHIYSQLNGEGIYDAFPKDTSIRDFNLCHPDSAHFNIHKYARFALLGKDKFGPDSGWFSHIFVIKNADEQHITIDYYFDMSKLKGKKGIIAGDGTFCR